MKTKGFTLVELLVVIAILAILATVSVVGYTSYIESADKAVAKEELSQARTSVMAADVDNDNFKLGTTELTWTVAYDATNCKDEAAAKAAVATALQGVTGLPGTFTLGDDTTVAKVPASGDQTGWTVTIKTVTYTTGNGSATWTITGNKIGD